MENIQLVQNVKVIFGAGCISAIGEIAQEKGSKRPLVVTDKGIVAAGIAQKALDVLTAVGTEPVLFDGVEPDPSVFVVEAAWDLFNREGCDLVIGLGGGSAMDSAKAINLLRYNEGPIMRYATEPVAFSPDLVSVPTTSGTGSELSDGLVISGPDGEKHPMLATDASSEYAVVDPELMVGMPPHITATTGIDALSHATEGFTGTVATVLTDQINRSTMEQVREWLPRAVADGSCVEARAHMAAACLMGGWMLRNSHTHASHSIAHILGGHFHMAHGYAVAYALPYVLEFNAPEMPEKTLEVARMFGANVTGLETPEQAGEKARFALQQFFFVDLGIKKPSEWEIDRTQFAAMGEEIENELFQAFNPRKMTAADAVEILEKIFA